MKRRQISWMGSLQSSTGRLTMHSVSLWSGLSLKRIDGPIHIFSYGKSWPWQTRRIFYLMFLLFWLMGDNCYITDIFLIPIFVEVRCCPACSDMPRWPCTEHPAQIHTARCHARPWYNYYFCLFVLPGIHNVYILVHKCHYCFAHNECFGLFGEPNSEGVHGLTSSQWSEIIIKELPNIMYIQLNEKRYCNIK